MQRLRPVFALGQWALYLIGVPAELIHNTHDMRHSTVSRTKCLLANPAHALVYPFTGTVYIV